MTKTNLSSPFPLPQAARYFAAVAALTLIMVSACVARSETFYVSPSGDDTGTGSRSRPFRTLAAACRKTPAGDNTILLAAGTYPETDQCVLPPGVSLVGAGQDRTILHWSAMVDMEKDFSQVEPDAFLIRVEDSANATLADFTIEGKLDTPDKLHDRAHGGIFANKVTHFQIHGITARSFNFGAIYLVEGTKSSVFQCRVEDSGHPHKEGCSGGILVGDVTDCTIHDNVIRENRGAYGIKGAKLSWGYPAGQPPVWQRKGDVQLHLIRLKVYHNDIKVRQTGGWGQGQPNMAMEWWSSWPEDCEIFENDFNECLSLAAAPGMVPPGMHTVRVHHNRLIMIPGYSYAIESSTHNVEIDHNYFANGYYPIASFGGAMQGINIHNNVFDNIEGIQLLYFNGGVIDFRFENNTVYLKKTFPILVLNSKDSENIRIANNLFYKEGEAHSPPLIKLGGNKKKPTDSATIKPGTLVIDNNAFVNWKPEGERAFTGDPDLLRMGRRDNFDFFRLRPDSPLLPLGIGATAPTGNPKSVVDRL